MHNLYDDAEQLCAKLFICNCARLRTYGIPNHAPHNTLHCTVPDLSIISHQPMPDNYYVHIVHVPALLCTTCNIYII